MSSSDASNANAATTATFVTALVFNLAVFGIQIGIFTLVRPFFPAIYQPRTYVPKESHRASDFSHNALMWPIRIFLADHHEIKTKNGMDAYFFVRFLRMIVRILVPIWLVSWIILLPITSVNTQVDGHDGLDRFIFGNISTADQGRYWAHLVLGWLFTIWIGWNLRREMKHFVVTRQRWLIDPQNASSASASTVLITGVPRRYLSESALATLFSHLPGGVKKVWLNRDLKDMPDVYERRLKAANKLESAETALLETAVKLHNKEQKAKGKTGKSAETKKVHRVSGDVRPLTEPSIIDEPLGSPVRDNDAELGEMSLATKLVPRNKRPSHRLPPFKWLPFSIPLMGKKVDSIEWAREELQETNQLLRSARRELARDVALSSALPAAESNHPDTLSKKQGPTSSQSYPPLNSAFVLFNQQIAAHMAAQTLTHHSPYRMSTKSIGVSPDDVIWSNLNMNPYEQRIRMAISWGITIALIVAWAIPVAFVGFLSNVSTLCTTYSWLAWICDLPPVVVGVISGILPPALLAVLMMLLPIVLRLLAQFEGQPQRTTIELSLMTRYFMFQVIHSFLIVTLSSGIIAALPGLLKDPSSIPTLLAQKLPQASTFFLTYIVLQGLSGTAAGFLQVVPLVLYYVKLFILGSTPRSIYNIKYTLRSVSWGTLFPNTTLLVVITISYSVISPIINGLSLLTFVLFYQLWKYLFLWQLDGSSKGETGGQFFPKAVQHVFVGMYLQQICLAALFFLARDEDGKASSIAQGALMIVLIAFTAFFNIIVKNSYDPLIEYLPLTLADQTYSAVGDANRRAAAEELAEQESVHSAQEEKERQASGSGTESISMRKRAPAADETATEVGTAKDYGASPSTLRAPQPHRPEALRLSSIPGVDEDEGPKDFYHPASVEKQPVVWIPRDTLGLGEVEERANRAKGIKVSTKDAAMDGKGHVDVQGEPPETDD